MSKDVSWIGVLLRFIAALALVYATYNPEGYSFYDWVKVGIEHPPAHPDWSDSAALKFVVGIVLLIAWLIFLVATRNSLGLIGVVLVTALCGGLIWLLSDLDLLDAESPEVMIHLGLIVSAIIMTLGLCWSHLWRRLTGQVDTEEVG